AGPTRRRRPRRARRARNSAGRRASPCRTIAPSAPREPDERFVSSGVPARMPARQPRSRARSAARRADPPDTPAAADADRRADPSDTPLPHPAGFHLTAGLERLDPNLQPDRPESWAPFMQEALKQALRAYAAAEVPVGCVIVDEHGRIVGRGFNQRELLQDPTAHAEMLAITAAAEARQSWHLGGCTLVVTLEPCCMCIGAIVLARFDRVVFGAWDPKAGACGSVVDVPQLQKLNHHPKMLPGVMAPDCGAILTQFFAERRRNKTRTPRAD
ncbi:MAG: nucleoside deaminase, partial [Rhodanobacteraceae bacterium]